ncbi:MerR family transcriptional regulator [Paracoccus beibuensis]|uniref:MerR family transcriptional regulator n=1 Tax=Paracoccus beibuensis TaxID=547602 RepID=UPI00223F5515|nr:MerR family transcriptional regulator [Paracoccus beibuensis]
MAKGAEAFRSIGEVANLIGVAPHVLRYWETQFPLLRPMKRADGRRYYRPADVALAAGLVELLRDKGLTIRGARMALAPDRGETVRARGLARLSGLAPDEEEPFTKPPDGRPQAAVDGRTDASSVSETGGVAVDVAGAADPDTPDEAETTAHPDPMFDPDLDERPHHRSEDPAQMDQRFQPLTEAAAGDESAGTNISSAAHVPDDPASRVASRDTTLPDPAEAGEPVQPLADTLLQAPHEPMPDAPPPAPAPPSMAEHPIHLPDCLEAAPQWLGRLTRLARLLQHVPVLDPQTDAAHAVALRLARAMLRLS